MNRFTLALAALAAALLLPGAALAKGPSAATVTGPGTTLRIAGEGESGGTPLGNLTQYAGFFPAAYSQEPDPMLKSRPQGRLGPKFTIHYVVPGPNSRTYRITQDLYPYAKAGALTYMKPGQPIFDMHTRGGWFPAGDALKQVLVQAGLPKTPPRASSSASLALFAGLGIPGALALLGAAVLVARRRRPADR
jgi:hypothetical protein